MPLRSLALVALVAALMPVTGCGPKLQPVTGSVTLDGKAVAGAAVTFVSDDGKFTASGVTDDSGNFTIASPSGPGAYAAKYKVTVTKYPKVEGNVPGAEGKMDTDYLKSMKKESDASKGGTKGPTGPPGAKGMMPPGGMMMPPGGGVATSGVKSELPEVYASIEKTPLTATVPAPGPVALELKSK